MRQNRYSDIIEHIQSSDGLTAALKAFAQRGICTQHQVEVLSKLSPKQARNALEGLAQPPLGLPAVIQINGEVALAGQRGRPQKVYSLLEAGQVVLQQLAPGLPVHLPQFHDAADLLHSYAEMEVFCAGQALGKKLSIESRIGFGDGGNFIIADIVLYQNQQRVLFEIEQQARRVHLARIEEKLSRLVQFYQSSQGKSAQSQLRILFNIQPDDDRTLSVWQSALQNVTDRVGQLPFSIHYSWLTEFLRQPVWDDLSGFQLLAAAPTTTPPPADEAPPKVDVPEFSRPEMLAVSELQQIVAGWAEEYPPIHYEDPRLELHRRRLAGFFETMLSIYEASHYDYGPTVQYAVYPFESINLLRRYLRLPQNQTLLVRLKKQATLVHANHERVMLARMDISKLSWTFAEHHGLARGGPFRINVMAPSFDGFESDFSVKCWMDNLTEIMGKSGRIQTTLRMNYGAPEERAASWVFEALYLYAEDLGLVEATEPPKAKRPGARQAARRSGSDEL